MPFAFSILNNYETRLAEEVVTNSELLAKPKNIRDTYSFFAVLKKLIVSLLCQCHSKLSEGLEQLS